MCIKIFFKVFFCPLQYKIYQIMEDYYCKMFNEIWVGLSWPLKFSQNVFSLGTTAYHSSRRFRNKTTSISLPLSLLFYES